MKKFFRYILIIIFLSLWGIILTNQDQAREAVKTVKEIIIKPCSKPLRYSIGTVDPRFNLSTGDFTEIVKESENVWEKSTGKNLFEYDSAASFKINLIFDSRQANTLEAENMEENLKNLELSHEATAKKYESYQSQYDKKMAAYEKAVKKYEERLENYNDSVNYWNDRGGAPEDEYKELKDDKDDLEDMYNDLEKQRKEINALAGKTNNLASQENKIANEYNSNLGTYKSRFGNSQEFEKGLFSGTEINIYQFKEKSDLRLTLSHELGHYLGIGHVENNSAALMYYLMGEQNLENPILTQEDIAEVNKICKIK